MELKPPAPPAMAEVDLKAKEEDEDEEELRRLASQDNDAEEKPQTPLSDHQTLITSLPTIPTRIPTLTLPPPAPPTFIPPIAPIPIPPPSTTANAAAAANTSAPDEYEVSEESRLARERQEKAVQDFLMKRRAYAMAVPTNDLAVRFRLRRLGEPVTLFGEREMERRDRLRSIMVSLDAEGQLERILKAHEEEQHMAPTGPEEEEEEGTQTYPFYTEGVRELLDVRVRIAKFSLVRAKERLERARRRRDDPDEDPEVEAEYVVGQARGIELQCSEMGDERPLSGCSFSHDGSMLATCAWSGVAKIWSMPHVQRVATLKGHTERATAVAFSPTDNCLATGSVDKTAILWNSDGSLLMTFNGHMDRLARVAFHPSGKYLGTASFDKTWRLWDVSTGIELLYQEGHSRSLYSVCFHPDGSLAASCGLDALARVWDLRTGRSILTLEGHVKPILGACFSPNGYHLATGGEDNTCRIWDLRRRKCLYIIPAHSHLISEVKYEPQEGYFLATASFDTSVKLWSSRDFKPIKTLAAHDEKVMGLDIIGDGQKLATVAYDRTIKLWESVVSEKDNTMDVD